MRTRLPALGGALALVATLVAAPAASAAPTVVASTLTDAPDVALTSYVNDAPAFASAGDAFGILARGGDLPFAIADDSVSIFPPDSQGIVGEDDLDPFFGVVDTQNGDNDGPVTATWTFDTAGATGPLFVNLDAAAMGDFESSDLFEFTISVDGGTPVVATVEIDEDGTRDYTLDGGATFTLSDPANLLGVELNDDFQSLAVDLGTTGDTVTVAFTAVADGGSEAFAFRNVRITDGGPFAVAPPVVASDVTAGPAVNLVSFVNDAPAFASAGDAFGILARGGDLPFAIADDSVSIFPPDSQGIVGEDDLDPFFGVVDTQNGDNDGPVTATWTFDTAGATGPLFVNLDAAAMGDFESSDLFEFTISVDGGTPVVATVEIDEDGTRDYTLDGGATFTLSDPANLLGVELNDDFQSLAIDLGTTGDTVTVAFTAVADGGSEAFAFRNVRITDGGPFAGDVVEPPVPFVCDVDELTAIATVQGDGFSSPLAGETVTVRGVVTLADSDLGGLFLQDPTGDGDPATSEAVFVPTDDADAIAEGTVLEAQGVVDEFFGRTQIGGADVAVCDVDDTPGIDPTPLLLPADDTLRESLENMVVTNVQDLQVTRLFTAYRFGELGLALDGPLPQPTSVFAPDDPAAQDLAAFNATVELIVNDRDEASSQFNPFPWELLDDDLSAGDTMLAGAVVGPLNFSFGNYKVEPVGDFPLTVDTDERAEVPVLDAGNDVAAFNVLNFFNTFGDSAVLRGATNAEDFAVQTAKIVDAINTLDAAVLGLIEIENDYEDFYDDDPDTVPSIVTLVEALNDDAGFAKWTWVQPAEDQLVTEGLGNGGLGTDAIAVGLIYQPDRAEEVGTAVTFDIDAALTGDSDNNRWPLAQTFQVEGPGPDVTVAVNHFKSKGSGCDDTAGPGFKLGDDVETDLTGNCNLVREYAAQQLVDWLDTRPTGADHDRNLVVGDLNSYEEEGPITVLESAGYVDMVDVQGDDAFTFKFDGRFGRLDYVMASAKAVKFVLDTEVWQINSRAPFGELYDNSPVDETFFASSDHDPVVISIGAPGQGTRKGPKG